MIRLFLIFAFSAASFSAWADNHVGLARERIKDAMIEGDIPAASVTVARGGEIIWSDAFGEADRRKNRKATNKTAFSVASIAKPVTATAIMILAERGLIDLDAPINHYLGDNKLIAHVGAAEDATVRRVLSHTAGLAPHHHFFYEDEKKRRHGHEENIKRYGKIVIPPGEAFEYSNFGYGLLEYVIERVSGKPYAAFLKDEIFTPLGMENSFVPPADPWPKNAARRYKTNGAAIPFYDFDHRGGAALYASTEDLARFGLFFLRALEGDSDILSAASARAMIAAQGDHDMSAHGAGGYQYGLGWFARTTDERTLIVHSGAMPGVAAQLTLSPEDKIVIAVAINNDGDYGAIYGAARQFFVPHLRSGAAEREIAKPVAGEWRGHIEVAGGKKLSVTLSVASDGAIAATLEGEPLHIAKVGGSHNGDLTLLFHDGVIQTPDALSYPHRLSLTLKRRGDALQGYATAVDRPQRDRGGSGVSFWVELTRG